MPETTTTLNANIRSNAGPEMQKVARSFRPAEQAARRFQGAVLKAGSALDSMTARASKVAGIAGALGTAALAVGQLASGGQPSRVGGTVAGAAQGAAAGALVGAPFGGIGAGVGAVIGAGIGGIQGFRQADVQVTQAEREQTRAMAELTLEIRRLRERQGALSSGTTDFTILERGIQRMTDKLEEIRKVSDAEKEDVEREINLILQEDQLRRLLQAVETGAASGTAQGVGPIVQNLEIMQQVQRAHPPRNVGSRQAGVIF